MALEDKLTAIADAIREKTGKTGKISLSEMPAEISSISRGSPTTSTCTLTVKYQGDDTADVSVIRIDGGDVFSDYRDFVPSPSSEYQEETFTGVVRGQNIVIYGGDVDIRGCVNCTVDYINDGVAVVMLDYATTYGTASFTIYSYI
jgi:hypothetical protein